MDGTVRRRNKWARPSLRARARPPKRRTALGQAFSAVNLSTSLMLQKCLACGRERYPSTEICGHCLSSGWLFEAVSGSGTLLATTELRHSLWEYFKRRILKQPWFIGSVRLDSGPTVIAHLGDTSLAAGDRVEVFSHRDVSLSAVMIAVAESEAPLPLAERSACVSRLGLDEPAYREGGLE